MRAGPGCYGARVLVAVLLRLAAVRGLRWALHVSSRSRANVVELLCEPQVAWWKKFSAAGMPLSVGEHRSL